MARKPRLTVVQESDSGLNQKFKDNRTGEILTRTQVARRIDSGIYKKYHHYRDDKKQLIIRSNPDGSENNNLG